MLKKNICSLFDMPMRRLVMQRSMFVTIGAVECITSTVCDSSRHSRECTCFSECNLCMEWLKWNNKILRTVVFLCVRLCFKTVLLSVGLVYFHQNTLRHYTVIYIFFQVMDTLNVSFCFTHSLQDYGGKAFNYQAPL